MNKIDFLPTDQNEQDVNKSNKNAIRKKNNDVIFTDPERNEMPQGILQNFLYSIKAFKKKFSKQIKEAVKNGENGGAEWGKSGVLGTNLIKTEVISFFNWRKKFYFLFVSAGAAVLIIILMYLSLIIWEKGVQTKDEILLSQIKKINEKIAEAEGYVKDILKFQKKLKYSGELLENHIYWTNFFTFLEDNTLSNVYYADFSGDIGGEYQLPASAGRYNDITRQLKSFKNSSSVEEVKTSGGKSGEAKSGQSGAISFDLDLKVKPEIFYK